MQDPFAAPAEEAQAQAPAGVNDQINAAVAAAPAAKPASVFQAGEGKIVTTLKAGAGYDQPWVVIHANSVAESDALLDQSFADYLAKVKKVAAHFNGGGSAPAGRPAAAGQPAGSTEAPSWAPPKPYDDFVYKTGVSAKNGKVWHAWMPPQKGDARPAKFFYND